MNILKEFSFLKGNMIEMAVGIVIGASFNAVVEFQTSPALMLKVKFSDFSFSVKYHGLFINTLVDFVIVGFTIFSIFLIP